MPSRQLTASGGLPPYTFLTFAICCAIYDRSRSISVVDRLLALLGDDPLHIVAECYTQLDEESGIGTDWKADRTRWVTTTLR